MGTKRARNDGFSAVLLEELVRTLHVCGLISLEEIARLSEVFGAPAAPMIRGPRRVLLRSSRCCR
jgi:hypothetical protein